MKRIIALLAVILVLVGCSNEKTQTLTLEQSNEYIKLVTKYELDGNDDVVTKIKVIYEYSELDDEETVKVLIDPYRTLEESLKKIDGYKMEVKEEKNSFDIVVQMDMEKLKEEEIMKMIVDYKYYQNEQGKPSMKKFKENLESKGYK